MPGGYGGVRVAMAGRMNANGRRNGLFFGEAGRNGPAKSAGAQARAGVTHSSKALANARAAIAR